MRSGHFRVLGFFALLTLLAATPAWAVFQYFAQSTQVVDGVDKDGNPSTDLGNKSSGKIYKDLATGVVLQINQAIVDNEFGYGKLFRNRGLTMYDPLTYEKLTSTRDVTIVYARTTKYDSVKDETGWGAYELKSYNPRLPPLTPTITSN